MYLQMPLILKIRKSMPTDGIETGHKNIQCNLASSLTNKAIQKPLIVM